MNNVLYEMIFKRKSFHIFRDVGNESISKDELNDIQSAYSEFSPLKKKKKTESKPPFALFLKSRRTANEAENTVFCFIVKRKTAICKTLVISVNNSIFIWYPEISERSGSELAKHKKNPLRIWNSSLCFLSVKSVMALNTVRICLGAKERTLRKYGKAIRSRGFAPSACNSQPWLVKNNGELSVYRHRKPGKRGIMPADKVLFYNRIDIGIFICFMDICLEHRNIAFEKKLYPDDGEDKEFVLNAVYRFD